MFSMEDKKAIVNDVFEKFHDRFGFYPESTGSYYMDADLTNYIKAAYPTVKCAVATCWEEGPKAYHTCNNSWYTLFDGGPWAPWIPSKQNTHAPAANAAEDSGIVAIPHLSYKDLGVPVSVQPDRSVSFVRKIQQRLCIQHDVCRSGLDEQDGTLGAAV